MRKKMKVVMLCFAIALVAISPSAYATNGMNMEGYGPIATGMGGASMAYDNGSAAMMNNPATIGLMPDGNRLDVALGYLGPDVKAYVDTPGGRMEAHSSGSAYYMPALGWVRKSGAFAYGFGVYAQGGMGTEYTADSFMAAGSGDKVRSELSVGRALIPIASNVNDRFTIGGSLDFVWASLDLKMAIPGAQFLAMTPGGSQEFGTVSGSMINTFGSFISGGAINPSNPVNWGRFDFSDDSAFSGKAKGQGYAAKIGGVYKINDRLSVGAAYHSKTKLSDLDATGATVSFNANVDTGVASGGAPSGTYTAATIPLHGKISVKDFQWPQMIGAGVSFQATDKLQLVFDYKWINWADTMKNFRMVFTADSDQAGLAQGFANTELDATLFQKWKDQHVFMIGAGYKFTDEFTGRIGANIANNPIPDTYMNALFPAIVENHYMIGAGYMVSKASSIDASFTYAPEVKATNGSGITVTHSQKNAQVMYSYRF